MIGTLIDADRAASFSRHGTRQVRCLTATLREAQFQERVRPAEDREQPGEEILPVDGLTRVSKREKAFRLRGAHRAALKGEALLPGGGERGQVGRLGKA